MIIYLLWPAVDQTLFGRVAEDIIAVEVESFRDDFNYQASMHGVDARHLAAHVLHGTCAFVYPRAYAKRSKFRRSPPLRAVS